MNYTRVFESEEEKYVTEKLKSVHLYKEFHLSVPSSIKLYVSGVLLWCKRLRLWCCQWSSWGRCYGTSLIPGPGMSIYSGQGQKNKQKIRIFVLIFVIWIHDCEFYFVQLFFLVVKSTSFMFRGILKIPDLLNSYVSLGKSLSLSKPQVPHLYNGDNVFQLEMQ